MDIYEFFDNRDAADNCKSTNRQFSPLEMAIIVNVSEHATLEQKHAAYRQIIADYPDMPISESRLGFESRESLHEYLHELMDFEERETENAQEDYGEFEVKVEYWVSEDDYGDYHAIQSHEFEDAYETFDEAKAAALEWDCPSGKFVRATVTKVIHQESRVSINKDGEILTVGNELGEPDPLRYKYVENDELCDLLEPGKWRRV